MWAPLAESDANVVRAPWPHTALNHHHLDSQRMASKKMNTPEQDRLVNSSAPDIDHLTMTMLQSLQSPLNTCVDKSVLYEVESIVGDSFLSQGEPQLNSISSQCDQW